MFRDAPLLSYDDLITGEKFVALCDAVWFHYEHRPFPPDPRSARVFYADTYRAEELLERLPRDPDRELVVVTHNSDRPVDDELAGRMPANVVAWYSANVSVVHPRLHPLPIGLENERWFPEQRKKQKILDYRAAAVAPSKLLYMNHNIATNPAARRQPYDLFEGRPWCTAVRGENARSYDEYLRDISQHFFVLSPEGNGIDCHRTWETLYMNRVPVLVRNAHTTLYEDLPALLVNDWSEVTEDRLRDEMDRVLRADHNFGKLTFSFWRQLIREPRAETDAARMPNPTNAATGGPARVEVGDDRHRRDPYSTHRPALVKLLQMTRGAVLELGCGHGSTPLIAELARGRPVLTLDNDGAWLAKFAPAYETDSHRLLLVDDWPSALRSPAIDREWDLVFVDQSPWEARHQAILALKGKARFFILHDCDYFATVGMFGRTIRPIIPFQDPGERTYGDVFKFWREYFPDKPWPAETGPPTLVGSDYHDCDLVIPGLVSTT